MSNTQNTDFDINALLDGTLDDLADMPEFRPYPIGTYRLQFKIEADKKDKTIFYSKLKVLETVELADANDIPVEVGAEAQVRYDLKNEYGQGAFKKVLAALQEHYNAPNNRALLEEVKDYIEVVAVTKHNKNKKNDQVYTDLEAIKVV
jgi:hypothetical protein